MDLLSYLVWEKPVNAPEKGRRLLPPATKETHFEAAKRLALIGCIKGGPTDVVRNRRKYLRQALRAKLGSR